MTQNDHLIKRTVNEESNNNKKKILATFYEPFSIFSFLVTMIFFFFNVRVFGQEW